MRDSDYRKQRGIVLIFFSALAFSLSAITGCRSKDNTESAGHPFRLTDKELLVYIEAVTRTRETAAFLPPRVTTAQIVADTLNAYLAEKDASSGYLTREEYRDFQRLQDDRYVGIGMEIEKDAEGNVLCFPAPGSAAAKAGIHARDRLKSIEGVPVAGKSLLTLGSLARGAPGGRLVLVIVTPAGIEKQVTLTRAMTSVETVSKYTFGSIPVIRIHTFTPSTKGKLAAFVEDWPKDRPAIIDLRGNRGGDLHAAIDSAQIFLPAGARIVSVTGRSTKHYQSNNTALNSETPIYLWQDEATASAAEVFIAALTQNRRAVSIGKQTFGKGTKQDILELSDGSALVLTTGHLATPDGTRYDGQGISPTHALPEEVSATGHYLERVRSLMYSERYPATR